LEAASKALEKARNTRPLTGPNGQPVIIRKASLGGRIFLYFVAFWFLMWMMGLDRLILRAVVAPFYPAQTSAAEQQQLEQLQRQMSQTPATPQAQGQPQEPAAGVPLSADAFLKEHQSAPPAQ
jgi:hypothetical protein